MGSYKNVEYKLVTRQSDPELVEQYGQIRKASQEHDGYQGYPLQINGDDKARFLLAVQLKEDGSQEVLAGMRTTTVVGGETSPSDKATGGVSIVRRVFPQLSQEDLAKQNSFYIDGAFSKVKDLGVMAGLVQNAFTKAGETGHSFLYCIPKTRLGLLIQLAMSNFEHGDVELINFGEVQYTNRNGEKQTKPLLGAVLNPELKAYLNTDPFELEHAKERIEAIRAQIIQKSEGTTAVTSHDSDVAMAKLGILHLLDVRRQRRERYQLLEKQGNGSERVGEYLRNNWADEDMAGEKIVSRMLSKNIAAYLVDPDTSREVNRIVPNPYAQNDSMTPGAIEEAKKSYHEWASARAIDKKDHTHTAEDILSTLSKPVQAVLAALGELEDARLISDTGMFHVTRRHDEHETSRGPHYTINDMGLQCTTPDPFAVSHAAKIWVEKLHQDLSGNSQEKAAI